MKFTTTPESRKIERLKIIPESDGVYDYETWTRQCEVKCDDGSTDTFYSYHYLLYELKERDQRIREYKKDMLEDECSWPDEEIFKIRNGMCRQ